jgi:FKBP-type peptidyl-prolyl cis-trans isomerase
MNAQNQTSGINVTGTGIAVALAVIVVLGFLFFGTKVFSVITKNPLTATATSTTTMEDTNPATDQTQTTAAGGSSQAIPVGTVESSAVEGIPANVTQLMSKDIKVGTGATAQAGDSVTVQYVGMLTNGTVFDASANHGTTGFTFNLGAGQVIKGWDEGVVGMKVGGTRELVIPASLGYGAQAVGSIPANSTLVFEVELLNVAPGAASSAGASGAAQ